MWAILWLNFDLEENYNGESKQRGESFHFIILATTNYFPLSLTT
jgi:hypothetical protein